MAILNIPFSVVPVETGYDPVSEDFPLNQSITVLDLVGPSATDRQHSEGEKRDLTLQDRTNKIINTLNYLFNSGPGSSPLVLFRDGSTAFLGPNPQDMGGFKIVNMANPVSAQDAATKSYVDTEDLTLLPLSGGRAMTGDLNFGGHKGTNLNTPSANTDAANKQYVDTQILTCLSLDGSRVMAAALNMGTFRITNMADPVAAQDSVTVHYLTIALGSYLPLAGGTMSGIINANNNRITNIPAPSAAGDAINKTYADGKLAKTGGTMVGNIDMNAVYTVYNMTEPVSPQDAATKNYVDTRSLQVGGTGNVMTIDLNFGTKKGVNAAAGVALTDMATVGQIPSGGRLGGVPVDAGLTLRQLPGYGYGCPINLTGTVISAGDPGVCAVRIQLSASVATYDISVSLGIASSDKYKTAEMYLNFDFDGTNYSLYGAGFTLAGATSLSGDVGLNGNPFWTSSSLPAIGTAIYPFAIARSGGATGFIHATLFRGDSSTLYILLFYTGDAPVFGSLSAAAQTMGIYETRPFLKAGLNIAAGA